MNVQPSEIEKSLGDLLDAYERLQGPWPTTNDELDELYGSTEELPVVQSPNYEESIFDASGQDATAKVTKLIRNYQDVYRRSAGNAFLEIHRLVSEVYLAMFRSLPEDHVLIDPGANAEFIARCRLAGAGVSDFALNMALLNARKAGRHSGIERGRVEPLNPHLRDQSAHACEMALRLVSDVHEREHGVSLSLDKILCNPVWRAEFDELAASLSPTEDLVLHRLVALSLRKDNRKRVASVNCDSITNCFRKMGRLLDIDPDADVCHDPGLYILRNREQFVFAGFAFDLRARIRSHLAHGNVTVARQTLWNQNQTDIELHLLECGYALTIPATPAVVHAIKRQFRPMLNFGIGVAKAG